VEEELSLYLVGNDVGAYTLEAVDLDLSNLGNQVITRQTSPGKIEVYRIVPTDAQIIIPPNQAPTANAGPDQTVRLGSQVTLNGSGSSDPDNSPSPLSFAWTKTAGPNASLTGTTTAKPSFTPYVNGLYTFGLVVNDGLANSTSASVNITVPRLGDIDLDGDVDNNDLSRITTTLNKPANGPNDLRDINGDMKLDALDTRKLVLLCTRQRCATQ
jgi:hypothetical protein